jgi:hypothetical protein
VCSAGVEVIAEGDACAAGDACELGTYCDTDGTATCVAFGDVGDPCSDTTHCGGDLWCDLDAGECAALPGEGESCLDSARCDGDLDCESDGGTGRVCVQPPPDPGVGDACTGGGGECGTPITTGLICDAATGEDGNCRAIEIVDEGGTCDPQSLQMLGGTIPAYRWCKYMLTSHYCEVADGAETGTCARRPGAGEPCADFDASYYGTCDRTSSLCVTAADDTRTCVSAVEGDACVDTSGGDQPTSCAVGHSCDEDDPAGPTCREASPFFEAPEICE